MRYVLWGLMLGFWLFFGAFLHYTLPQKDIARITGTEIIRKDFSGMSRWFYARGDTGDAQTTSRDLRLINTTRESGSVMVYRNEDTGFGWPPYFKIDSSDLHAEAADFLSTQEAPRWVVITHYGWRSQILSIHPNVVSIREIPGPNAPKGFPWFNTVFLILLAAVIYSIWVRWRRFRRSRIDPVIEEWQDGIEATSDSINEKRSRIRRFFGGKRP